MSILSQADNQPVELLLNLRSDAAAWCRGKNALVRLPLLIYFAWVGFRLVGDRSYWSLIAPLNLGIHELGHMGFQPFGKFLAIAGGSLLQCIVPCGAVAMFYKQRDFFAIAIALCWLSTNMFYVATYMADASHMQLQLVSVGGGDAIHDWNYLLGETGLIRHDALLAGIVTLLAAVVMALGLAMGAWLLWKMTRSDA